MQAREKRQHSNRHLKLDEGSILKTDSDEIELNWTRCRHPTGQISDEIPKRVEESLSDPSQLIFFGKRTAYCAVFFFLPPTSVSAIKQRRKCNPGRRNMQIDIEVMGHFRSQSSVFFLIYTRNENWLYALERYTNSAVLNWKRVSLNWIQGEVGWGFEQPDLSGKCPCS